MVQGKNLKVSYKECVADLSDFLEVMQVNPTNRDNWKECVNRKCDRCRGDCDSNGECKSPLQCHQRDAFDTVGRSCVGSDSSGYDYCVAPNWVNKKVSEDFYSWCTQNFEHDTLS